MHTLTNSILASTVFNVEHLRTYTGKAQSMASLLYVWRPFVHMLYGAIASDALGGAPSGLRWTKQIATPPKWLRASLDQTEGSLTREWYLQSYLNRGPQVVITTDASPWGVGATLEINNEMVTYLCSQIITTDRSKE